MTGLERVWFFAAENSLTLVQAIGFADEIPELTTVERGILKRLAHEVFQSQRG